MPLQRGTAFFFNALAVHRGSGISKAAPTGVSDPRLIVFFVIELTQGPNLRFPYLHVSQAIKWPHLGAPVAWATKTAPCEGAARCRWKVVAKCYGCERGLCAAHKDGLRVPCQEEEEPEGGGGGGGGVTPIGSALSNVLNACPRWEQPPGIFC